jgi:hypothetical protein
MVAIRMGRGSNVLIEMRSLWVCDDDDVDDVDDVDVVDDGFGESGGWWWWCWWGDVWKRTIVVGIHALKVVVVNLKIPKRQQKH